MVVQHNLTAMNSNRMLGVNHKDHRLSPQRSYLPVTRSTVQQMMQQVFPSVRR